MNFAQILAILLYGAELGMDAYRHGEPKEGEHNFFITAIAIALSAAILYWGGFWDGMF